MPLWLIPCAVALVIAVLVLIIAVKTARFKPLASVSDSGYSPDGGTADAERLAEAARVRTVSYIDGDKIDRDAFLQFHGLLEKQFPLLHARCEKTVVGGFSLLYHLQSDHPEPKGRPVLVTAHMDVVPVEAGTEDAWTEPAFSGHISDGFVWGRGTLDTKEHLIGAMAGLERVLSKGILPARDVYLAFGHDEELSGLEGAGQLAALFKARGLDFEFVLDEGSFAVRGALSGIDKPLALVGVGEKGYANIRLTVTRDGGHASMPAPHTSLGILAKAICRIEAHPMRPRLIAPTRAFLLRVGPHMTGFNKVILANLWLFKPLFLRVFSKTNTGGALLRTTTAVTMAQGSPAPNVVPQKASAVVNCRILPGDDGTSVLAHFRKRTKGLGVDVEPLTLEGPSETLSPADSDAFHYLEGLINEFCPGSIVAPYLLTAASDAKKYECVSKNVFRFTPCVIDSEDMARFHGTNERVSISNINRCVDFFAALFERL